jgi:predicted dehydrogenase
MKEQEIVRLAIIGAGNMGRLHARDVHNLPHTELAAICDINQEVSDQVAAHYQVDAYYDHSELLENADLDGIIIATPHYDHPPITVQAFERGLHVLVEKPVAVHVKDGRKMIDAYHKARQIQPDLVFGAIFMQRTYGYYLKIKELIANGELGKLVRATWIITNWFRTQTYYDSGGWRATWAGEGGGVLLNQSPHNLDLFQWFVGMPDRVTGFAAIGKYHQIEVEDEVTAFFTSTAESPGTNRLEIVGEKGKLVFEDEKLLFYRNSQSMFDFIAEATASFDKVENRKIEVPYTHHGRPGHKLIIENFGNAIINGEPLIAPAVEGIHSVMLGNAIIFSSFLNRPIPLPIDEDAYEQKLHALIEASQSHNSERIADNDIDDTSKSF